MNFSALETVVNGNLQALDEGSELVSSLSDHQYIEVVERYASSSIGQHFRHVLDMFYAVMQGYKTGTVDYDVRRRGADIEHSRQQALNEINEVRSWMLELKHADECDVTKGFFDVRVSTEVLLKEQQSVDISSTLARELIFVGSHAVHHYALIGILAKLQGVSVKNNFGVAPATATFLRAMES